MAGPLDDLIAAMEGIQSGQGITPAAGTTAGTTGAGPTAGATAQTTTQPDQDPAPTSMPPWWPPEAAWPPLTGGETIFTKNEKGETIQQVVGQQFDFRAFNAAVDAFAPPEWKAQFQAGQIPGFEPHKQEKPEIFTDPDTGQTFFRGASGGFQPFNAPNPAETIATLDQQIDKAIIDGDFQFASALAGIKNAPTSQESFDRALSFAKSPGDSFILNQIQRNLGGVKGTGATPGDLRRLPKNSFLTQAFLDMSADPFERARLISAERRPRPTQETRPAPRLGPAPEAPQTPRERPEPGNLTGAEPFRASPFSAQQGATPAISPELADLGRTFGRDLGGGPDPDAPFDPRDVGSINRFLDQGVQATTPVGGSAVADPFGTFGDGVRRLEPAAEPLQRQQQLPGIDPIGAPQAPLGGGPPSFQQQARLPGAQDIEPLSPLPVRPESIRTRQELTPISSGAHLDQLRGQEERAFAAGGRGGLSSISDLLGGGLDLSGGIQDILAGRPVEQAAPALPALGFRIPQAGAFGNLTPRERAEFLVLAQLAGLTPEEVQGEISSVTPGAFGQQTQAGFRGGRTR